MNWRYILFPRLESKELLRGPITISFDAIASISIPYRSKSSKPNNFHAARFHLCYMGHWTLYPLDEPYHQSTSPANPSRRSLNDCEAGFVPVHWDEEARPKS